MTIPYGPILLVEDIPNVRELLEVQLKFKGYQVTSARNGEEALARVAQEHPAVVISDILMPGIDGFAFAHHLRKNPKNAGIPIIFLSATYVAPEDMKFGMALGAYRYLSKPIDLDELLMTLGEILTGTPHKLPGPLSDVEFYRGYRERLEVKLAQKIQQVTRAERLVNSVPPEQRDTFQALLDESRAEREGIEAELRHIYEIQQSLGL